MPTDNKTGVFGMDGAIKITEFLRHLPNTKIAGIALHSDSRPGKASNADIIKYLADAKEHRDILPDKKAQHKAAKVWLARVKDKLARLVDNKLSKRKQQRMLAKIGQRQANNAVAIAFRAAGKYLLKDMTDNIKGPFTPVGDKYAKQRKRKFGVPESSVMKASGRLLRNLKASRLKLHKR